MNSYKELIKNMVCKIASDLSTYPQRLFINITLTFNFFSIFNPTFMTKLKNEKTILPTNLCYLFY